MLGFDALARLALGQVPAAGGAAVQTLTVGPSWERPLKAGLSAAVIATTFAGFVPPTPAQAQGQFVKFSTPPGKQYVQSASWQFVAPSQTAQTAVFTQFSYPQPIRVNPPDEQPSTLFEVASPPVISIAFTQFSQPLFLRSVIPDEQPSALFVEPPQYPPFTGFATFEGIIRARSNIALTAWEWWQPIILPIDTHDGVWVKRKRKKFGPDLIELELAEKAARRAALELAVYGPEVKYTIPEPVFEAPKKPIDVTELAKVIAAAQASMHQTIMAQQDQDEENDLDAILREIL